MVDFKLDSDFSPYQDDTGNFPSVSGSDEVEQTIPLLLTDYLEDTALGTTSDELIKQKIKLQVTRLAREYDPIDTIRSLSISASPDKPNTFIVEVGFETVDEFSFELQV